MKKNEAFRSSLINNDSRESAQNYQRENLKSRRKQEDDFFNQSFDYRDYVISPQGYEGVALSIYIITLPYLLGLMFLFLFVAKASYEYFLQFDLASFFIIWAIGYEACAVLILAIIFLIWLKSISNRWNGEKARKPPTNHRGY
ncbi:MAG: hypothetical protein WC407_11455 [Sulfuricurvum sp.]